MKKIGRPARAVKQEQAEAMAQAAAAMAVREARSDADILKEIQERFEMLHLLTRAAMDGSSRALIVSGGPGVGKSHDVITLLREECPEIKTGNEKGKVGYEVVSGSISAINLYMLGYRMRAGGVIVIDDADDVFRDEESLNLLKILCSTSVSRHPSWLKESAALRDNDVPTSYEFQGAVIFISNIDFQKIIDEGRGKLAAHVAALSSRAFYLDLLIHSTRAKLIWIRHIATKGKMLAKLGVSNEVGKEILDFMTAEKETLRELSLRSLEKLAALSKSSPKHWRSAARILMCRQS